MQSRSEQSVSPVQNGGASGAVTGNTCGHHDARNKRYKCSKWEERIGSGTSAGKVTEMLKKSLAVLLVRVGNESGPGTAEKILDVLRDEYFDLDDFLQTVSNLKTCQQITKEIVDGKK